MIDDTDPNLSIDDRDGEMVRWVASLPGYRCLEFLGPSRHRSHLFIVLEIDSRHDLDLWISDRPSLGPAALDRFKNLAKVAADIKHPQIQPILDGGVHEGRTFLLMAPHFVGRDLRERIESQPLPVAEAVELTISLAMAVHYVHEQGMVQLDLMTNGVLFRGDGLMMIDLRRTLERRLLDEEGEWIHGGITGCEAPEMFRGSQSEIGRATDVYALGAILYQMLTGRPALIRGAVGPAAIRSILESEPEKPRKFNRDVDRGLESICLRCLNKDPKGRYPSAQTLADGLERWRSKDAKTAS